ncbi:hypothetical protein MMC34_000040 [Xylographa carneopallida]|nr:hypothetical protein [Xylographa carneopallida]
MGDFESRYPSSVSAIAANVVSSALELRIPLICFFCRSSDLQDLDRVQDIRSSPEIAALDFLHSFMRQLIDLLPRRVKSVNNLTKARFAKLDGSLESYQTGLAILKALFDLAPPALLIVVDGIEQFDKSEVTEEMDAVLDLVQRRVSPDAKTKTVFKALYTTAGRCEAIERLDQSLLKMARASQRSTRTSSDRGRSGQHRLRAALET